MTSIPGEWFKVGYEQSLDALRQAIDAGDEPTAFVAMFATLNWAASIRDYLKREKRAAWQDDTVQSVQFVRNAVHHDWALAIQIIAEYMPTPRVITPIRAGGMQIIGPPVMPTGKLLWAWPDVSDLPPPKHDWGKAEYIRDLERRPVLEALERLSVLYAKEL